MAQASRRVMAGTQGWLHWALAIRMEAVTTKPINVDGEEDDEGEGSLSSGWTESEPWPKCVECHPGLDSLHIFQWSKSMAVQWPVSVGCRRLLGIRTPGQDLVVVPESDIPEDEEEGCSKPHTLSSILRVVVYVGHGRIPWSPSSLTATDMSAACPFRACWSLGEVDSASTHLTIR